MSKLENNTIEEDDDYEDTESIKLLSQANKILNEKELTDDNFKFFTQMNQEMLMKVTNQLSKEKAEKLMNYLSRQKVTKKEEKQQKSSLKSNGKYQNSISSSQASQQQKNQYFNPSAPVWLDEKVGDQNGQNDNNPNILNQLLKEHEEEQNQKIGKSSNYLYKNNKKYRMDLSQFQFEEMAKYHNKQTPIFPFYSIVAKVMYSYGDLLKNDEKAVEMMHSQIEELIKAIFDKKLIMKLIKYCKQNSQNLYELDDESPQSKEKFIFPKATKTIKRCFNQYFQTVFAEQFKVYQRFRATYQGIKEEGGFFHNNKDKQEQKDEVSSNDSSDDSVMNNEDEDQGEDHQLREMKDHFDRDDEEEENNDDDENNKNNSVKLNNKDNNSQNKNNKNEKKNLIFFDENDEDDDEDDQNQEEVQETMDTLNQIEKISSLVEENKKDLADDIEELNSQQISDKDQLNKNLQISKDNESSLRQKQSGDKLYINDEDRIKFNKERTDEMTNEEWNYFMNVRSSTFTSNGNRKQFIELLNVNRFHSQFIEAINVFIPFLSYCFSKIIGIVVEQILRSRSNGQLQQTEEQLNEREIQIFGNQIIERYINRAKKHILSKEKLIKQAFQQFSAEFTSNGYDAIVSQEKTVPIKQSKGKGKNTKDNSKQEQVENKVINEQFIRDQWKGMKNTYKKMWVERVISEKQIKRIIEEKTQNPDQKQALQDLLRTDSSQIQFINKYASYLYERVLEDMQKNWLHVDYALHFKNWFVNNDSQRTGQIKKAVINNLQNQTKDQKRKILKFESILD